MSGISPVPERQALPWRPTQSDRPFEMQPQIARQPTRPSGLRGFWHYMTTTRPRGRWIALWRSSLPCAAGCPPPIAGIGYLELDADLTIRGDAEVFTCAACGKRFVLMDITRH
jgi:hypothetical protein